jgi:hypothetical protein
MRSDGFMNNDFSDGRVISNGISRVKNKHIYTKDVLEKNTRRNEEFDTCALKDFLI